MLRRTKHTICFIYYLNVNLDILTHTLLSAHFRSSLNTNHYIFIGHIPGRSYHFICVLSELSIKGDFGYPHSHAHCCLHMLDIYYTEIVTFFTGTFSWFSQWRSYLFICVFSEFGTTNQSGLVRWTEHPFLVMQLSTWKSFCEGSTTFTMNSNRHLPVLRCLLQVQQAFTRWRQHYPLYHAVWRRSSAQVLYQAQMVSQQEWVSMHEPHVFFIYCQYKILPSLMLISRSSNLTEWTLPFLKCSEHWKMQLLLIK